MLAIADHDAQVRFRNRRVAILMSDLELPGPRDDRLAAVVNVALAIGIKIVEIGVPARAGSGDFQLQRPDDFDRSIWEINLEFLGRELRELVGETIGIASIIRGRSSHRANEAERDTDCRPYKFLDAVHGTAPHEIE
ncbi:hypothetical protein [uncultured Methylovirgula sp.]|uniref:hypothetical protein n=1 Tax=uncultured Methylovirgula sp. TaxID=1285960 RepID=UPI002638FB3D|nr:hypothetical protein [uncultured Methylovirgula sp.]